MCAYEYTHFQLAHKHESADAKRYTYQTQTAKPVLMADSAASSMELIEAAHVSLPHVAPGPLGQALCMTQFDKCHGSLAERDEGNWKQDCVQLQMHLLVELNLFIAPAHVPKVSADDIPGTAAKKANHRNMYILFNPALLLVAISCCRKARFRKYSSG